MMPSIQAQDLQWGVIQTIPKSYLDNEDIGSIVSVDVDGNTAVIGAPNSNGGRGRLYILELQNDTWTKVATLEGGSNEQAFGFSVSISNNRIVVAPRLKEFVYLIEKHPSYGWNLNTSDYRKLYFSEGYKSQQQVVKVKGNVIVASAIKELEKLPNSNVDFRHSSVFIFTEKNNTWNRQQISKLPEYSGDNVDFGTSIAINNELTEIFISDFDGVIHVLERSRYQDNSLWYIRAELGPGFDQRVYPNQMSAFGRTTAGVGNTFIGDRVMNLTFNEGPLYGDFWVSAPPTAHFVLDQVSNPIVHLTENQLWITSYAGGTQLFEKEAGARWSTAQKIWSSEIGGAYIDVSGDNHVLLGTYRDDAVAVVVLGQREVPALSLPNQSVAVGNSLTLDATTNSTGAISYSIVEGGEHATLNVNTLTPLSVGSVTIEATVAGNAQFAENSITATVTVEKALGVINNFQQPIIVPLSLGTYPLAATTNSDAVITYSMLPIPGYDAARVDGNTLVLEKVGMALVQASIPETDTHQAATAILPVQVLPAFRKSPDDALLENARKINSGQSIHDIRYYPNPSTDRLNISFQGANTVDIRIFNLNGQLVASQQHVKPNQAIELTSLEKGMYLVELTSDEYIEIKRIIKQ